MRLTYLNGQKPARYETGLKKCVRSPGVNLMFKVLDMGPHHGFLCLDVPLRYALAQSRPVKYVGTRRLWTVRDKSTG